jgi:hypothetical protein
MVCFLKFFHFERQSFSVILKKHLSFLVMVLLQAVLPHNTAFAHPGSGIVVDKYGNVYFIHTGVGVAKISVDGKLTYIHKATDGHWMCLDELGFFSNAQPKYFESVRR